MIDEVVQYLDNYKVKLIGEVKTLGNDIYGVEIETATKQKALLEFSYSKYKQDISPLRATTIVKNSVPLQEAVKTYLPELYREFDQFTLIIQCDYTTSQRNYLELLLDFVQVDRYHHTILFAYYVYLFYKNEFKPLVIPCRPYLRSLIWSNSKIIDWLKREEIDERVTFDDRWGSYAYYMFGSVLLFKVCNILPFLNRKELLILEMVQKCR